MSSDFQYVLYVGAGYVFRRILHMDKESIKKRITGIRIAKDISARKLSLDMGYSSEHINQIETGRLNPTLDFILTFCDHLNIPLGQFFNDGFEYSPQITAIVKNLGNLGADELDAIALIVGKLGGKN